MQESVIRKNTFDEDFSICVHDTIALDQKAKMAAEMVSRWGMVSGVPDGEDSSGRQKIRLMTEEELVARAMLTTELFYEQALQKQWFSETPTAIEIMETMKGDEPDG